MSPRFEPITGRYLQLDLLGKPHRLYVEEAGQGIPLLCLHTAGSDARQYRGLMNDARITENFRVIAFDMPWHGKSSPPAGWQDDEYQLTSRDYVRMIVEVADALGLDRAGRDGLLDRRPHRAASRARASRAIPRADRPGVGRAHRALLRSVLAQPARRAWRHGLRRRRVRPGRADRAERRTLGNAVALHAERARRVQGRSAFLHDRRRHPRPASATSTSSAARCFCSPANTIIPAPPRARSTVAKRTGAAATIMKGLGHFPMSEDPEKFIGYLLPVLEKIRGVSYEPLASRRLERVRSASRPSGFSVSGSKVRISVTPPTSMVTTMWSAPTRSRAPWRPSASVR